MRRVGAAGVLASLGVLLTVLMTVPVALVSGLGDYARPVLIGLAWAAFAAAILVVRCVPRPLAVRLLLVGAVTMPLAGALVAPTDSDDVYRYVWDGRVQAHGIDAYQYPPAATALVPLRDPALWPPSARWCVPPGEGVTAGCTLINRPTEHTIYPPVAQVYFRAVHGVSPPGAVAWPFQFAGALLAIATTLVLLRSAKARDADPRSVIAWAWCPAVALEAANNAHVDALAALLTLLALLCLSHRGRDRWLFGGSALLGLAIATKLTPVLVVPSVVRRRPAIVGLTIPLVIAIFYIPHLARVGTAVVGYLPGYLTAEGYAGGTRFALLTLLLPARLAGAAAVVILLGVAYRVGRATHDNRPWPTAATMIGAALLVVTPGYQWYALLLVLMVGMGSRTVWLTVVAAGYLASFSPMVHVDGALLQRVGYGLALVAVVATVLVAGRWRGWVKPSGPAGPAEPTDSSGSSGSGEPAAS